MTGSLRVAIIGTGPAGMYATEWLLSEQPDCTIDLYDRRRTPWGLVRYGVAPDHGDKKQILDRRFELLLRDDRVALYAGVSVGEDISLDELRDHYTAVILATGAAGPRTFDVPGADLRGSWPAHEVVRWVNGEPDAAHGIDLSHERAIVVGNGNVALDVARILASPAARLGPTLIAEDALARLRTSAIREVVVLGRRGPNEAAFHNPELEEFETLDGVSVAVEGWQPPEDWADVPADTRRKLRTLQRLQTRATSAARRRIRFRFFAAPLELLGGDSVEAIRIASTASEDAGAIQTLETGLVIHAIGYAGAAAAGFAADADVTAIPNDAGRVLATGRTVQGLYVAGWAKRGARGMIGTNRKCAHETVTALLEDHRRGLLGETAGPDPRAWLQSQPVSIVSKHAWRLQDRAEREGRRIRRSACKPIQGRPL